MSSKKAFQLYKDWKPQIESLTVEDRGILLTAIYEYEESGNIIDMPLVVSMAFSFIRAQLDRDADKYETKANKNRDNANKRWDKPDDGVMPADANACERIFNDANHADTDTVTDTVKDTDTETDTDIKSTPAREKYGEFGNVLLTADEYLKLTDRYGKNETDRAVEELSAYCRSKGKRYKDYYATLVSWCKRNAEKAPPSGRAGADKEYSRMGAAAEVIAKLEAEERMNGKI